LDKKTRKEMVALLQKVNMTDLVGRAVSDSLKFMDEDTLFISEPLNGKLGNVVVINDLIRSVSERLKKKRIKVSSILLLYEVSRVLEHSIKKGSAQLVIARDRLNGLPVVVIEPDKTLIEYNKNFPERTEKIRII